MKRVLLIYLAMIAYAVGASSQEIDLTPITDQAIPLLVSLIGALFLWLGNMARMWLATKTDIANTDLALKVQAQYNEAVARAMAYAETKAQSKAGELAKFEVDNEFVANAANYLIKMWPGLVSKMDLEGIKDTIVARLPTGPLTEKAELIAADNVGAIK